MKTIQRGVAALAVAFAAAAAAPAAEAQHGQLDFSYTQSQSAESPQSATGGTGSISFTGSLTTGTPCYELSGSHAVRGSRVILTVTATGTGGMCTQVVTHNNYQGSISGLAPGDYTFEVVHGSGGSRETVYTTQVTVS